MNAGESRNAKSVFKCTAFCFVPEYSRSFEVQVVQVLGNPGISIRHQIKIPK